MSTAVWPPIEPDQLIKEEEASLARELEWLLDALQETLQSLKDGLEECAAALAPTETGSTLVLSTSRSENLKGFVTRVGTRIIKGDIKLRLPSLPPPRGANSYPLTVSSAPQASTLVVEQLTAVRTLINSCLDVIDATRWAGDAKNANYVSGQIRLLHDNVQEAKGVLKGFTDFKKPWWESRVDENAFDPPLPPNVDFHLYIAEAAIVVEVRTLEPFSPAEESTTGFQLRKGLAAALGGSKMIAHDEAHETFKYQGHDVRVKEKIRVEAMDPSIIAAMTKLSALEHHVALSLKALDVVMGKDE